MNDTEMNRVRKIINLLKKNYPGARIALKYDNPAQLLVAVMLSAQCTDSKVNEVTKNLFEKHKNAKDFAEIDIKILEKDMMPTGFYKVKARHIKESFKIIVEKYNSKIPRVMDDLIELPGVARKTANIVLSNAYGIVEGIAVDTHVKRLSKRLGLTNNNNPDKIEQDLIKLIPKQDWFKFTYLLIEHGREICAAKKPLCEDCFLNKVCPSAFKSN
jgi:endonuclease-3